MKTKRYLAWLAGPLSFGLLIFLIYHPIFFGNMPWIADHSVHQMKAWIFYNKIISGFSLTGWTDFASGGYPAELLYPPLADIYISLIKFISFGFLTWEQVYALSFGMFLVFYYFTYFFIGNKIGGRVGAFASGVFALIDMGAFRQGGWIFMVRWGVWPLSFAIALTLASLFFLHEYLDEKSTFRKPVIFSSLALLCHPMSLLTIFPVSIALLWFHFFPSIKRVQLILRYLKWSVFVVMITAWWLFPFLSFAPSYSVHVSAINGTINNIANGFWNFQLWGNSPIWVLALGFWGCFRILKDGHDKFMLALLSSSLIILVVTSSTVIGGLGLFESIPSLKHVQFPRYLLFVKASLFFSAAIGVKFLIEWFKSSTEIRWHIKSIFIIAFMGLIIPGILHFTDNYLVPLTKYPFSPEFKKGIFEIAKYLKDRKKADDSFYRVALDGSFGEHRHAAFSIYSGLPFVKLSFVPAQTYKYRAKVKNSDIPRSTEQLKLLNVRYIVSMGPSRIKKIKLLKKSYGLYLYEFMEYSSKRVFTGTAGTKSYNFENNSLNLTLDGGIENNEIRFNIHPFRNWKVKVNGKDAELSNWSNGPLTFMKVYAPRDAVIKLYYKKSTLEYISLIISIIFILLFMLPVSWSYPVGNFFEKKLSSGSHKIFGWISRVWHSKNGRIFFITIGIITTGLVLYKSYVLSPFGTEYLKLRHANVKKIVKDKSHKCLYFYPARHYCGTGTDYVGIESRGVGREIYTGIFLHPSQKRTYELTWEDVKIQNGITLEGGLDDTTSEGKKSVFIKIFFNNKLLKELKFYRKWHWNSTFIKIADKGNLRILINADSSGNNFLFRVKKD
ncbi:MAG: hypothetical protein JXR95_00975 [Deltaproteobacteria bacterium]|nr:hypothetical protein [Deltaproteobacteria bacterium]